ncbi:MAG: hypothetical protein C0503_09525 [Gemmatimonas sp.]|nr:hypothetical protein [Gemmatimonas sp.]
MKPIATYGIARSGAYVRVAQVTLASGPAVQVQWREGVVRHKRAFPATTQGRAHAKAFAQGTHQRLSAAPGSDAPRITLEQLFERYVLACEASWRPKTRINEINRWRYFVQALGPNTFAHLVTPDTLDELRRKLIKNGGSRGQPIAPNQVHAIISNVCRVWRLATARRWIESNPLAGYRIPRSKEDRPMDVDEFHPDEAAALMRKLPAGDSRFWRAHVACRIAGTQGPRVNALLLSHDADWDLEARVVRWRAETDKLGRERFQPLTRDAVAAVRIARIWRQRIGYTGKYLLPATKAARRAEDLPWTYQALQQLLHRACKRAGVQVKKFRALHGFRRMAATNVIEATGGDVKAAGDWIGDNDLRVLLRSYAKKRPEKMVRVANLIQMPTEGAASATPERHSTPAGRP